MFDQRGELPLLPFGYPIGFVPASRGGVNLKSIDQGALNPVADQREELPLFSLVKSIRFCARGKPRILRAARKRAKRCGES